MSRKPALVAAIVVQFAAISSFQTRAVSEPLFTDFPFMVHCKRDGIDRAFYLATIGPDGVALYMSPDRQAGTITITGSAKPLVGQGGGSCAGKTLQQLREAGQAFDVRPH